MAAGSNQGQAPAAPRSQAAEFLLAGIAACGAITFANPIDVVKTRLQLQGELAASSTSSTGGGVVYRGIGQALVRIARTEGLAGLQRGLGAAYLLQFSNVGCRFGGYSVLKQMLGVKPGESAGGMVQSMALGAASGTLAAVVSNPFFLLKSRFQAIGSEAVRHQHLHSSLRTAFLDIGRQQGPMGYYRGLSAFVPRVAAATSVQMSTYDGSKEIILSSTGARDGIPVHFAASLLSGAAVTLAMQPFDIVSVRLMNQPLNAEGRGALYSGPLDCAAKSLQAEGMQGLYKGTVANYARFGPYCILTFLFLEQLRLAWDRSFSHSVET